MTSLARFPFSAVVGQDEARMALLLAAVDPGIGGVLLRGDKGSAKSTLARGLAGCLGRAPFVELPLGATEDRVLGTIDLKAALTRATPRSGPGCWRPPTAASSTSTRSTCSPTTWSTCCWTWPGRASTSWSATASRTRTRPGSCWWGR